MGGRDILATQIPSELHHPLSQVAFSLACFSSASSAFSAPLRWVESLNSLTGGVAAGPGPLEVVAAEVAGDVHDFADEIQAGLFAGFHGL